METFAVGIASLGIGMILLWLILNRIKSNEIVECRNCHKKFCRKDSRWQIHDLCSDYCAERLNLRKDGYPIWVPSDDM